ncbi:2-amino-4-hydroxy-6-hydroxymethyldihydropteridine diphosphokinase [Homoserinimonas sp. OAct 916]|uniref:2-amino-4-hydroxy-6- hydroxymethyldihydropteridine diphosphokinase n=1 Tax=Homoserinimonas sp. OAct 916 TaxID=2211450 RepID=UPI000DBE4D3F|nr:2-amino-4-hydroxy-6-hydroxymethyldihydropteridine diphosphokinase [Homoserinimonas sp. OAct 916]
MKPKPQRLQVSQRAVLALGSNLGDREATLEAAVRDIGAIDGVHVESVSSLVESAAVKPSGVDRAAPSYLNAVMLVRSVIGPEQLLDAVNAIEDRHGRVREERWGDRTLDIDIIAFDGVQRADDRLTLPHPRAAERAFVVQPWLEIDPAATLPGIGPVADLPAASDGSVRRVTNRDDR